MFKMVHIYCRKENILGLQCSSCWKQSWQCTTVVYNISTITENRHPRAVLKFLFLNSENPVQTLLSGLPVLYMCTLFSRLLCTEKPVAILVYSQCFFLVSQTIVVGIVHCLAPQYPSDPWQIFHWIPRQDFIISDSNLKAVTVGVWQVF